jgi:hypothetical protein
MCSKFFECECVALLLILEMAFWGVLLCNESCFSRLYVPPNFCSTAYQYLMHPDAYYAY